jgi:ABC-2 type transport system permease protein
MQKTLLIAWWEFRSAVVRRAYLLAVVLLPLFFGGIGVVSALATRSAATANPGGSIGLIDKTAIVDIAFASAQAARREETRTGDAGPAPILAQPVPIVAYSDVDAALADLKARKLLAVFVIEADYVVTGDITMYTRDTGLFGQPAANQRANQVGDAIRASLLRKGLSGDELARAYAPAIRLKRFSMDNQGKMEDASGAFGIRRFASSFGVFMLFMMSVFFSAGFLQQATIEDRQNRVFEVLLSSATADQLLMGKILGLGGAGLLQVAIYTVLLIVPGMTMLSFFQVPVGRLALLLVYFANGYLLFASFMAATGMIGRTPQESTQLSAFWTMAAISPMFFIASITAAPNGVLARALSFFPLSAPVTMMLRLTTSEVPTTDIVVSIAIGAVSVYVALRATSKIFRAATLMYGKRPNLPELMRWLRAT